MPTNLSQPASVMSLPIDQSQQESPISHRDTDPSVPDSQSEFAAGFKLFVGCLPYEAKVEDLRPLFAKFGEIIELVIQRDKSGFSKGCAWLRYTTREACEDCIHNLHNQYYLGSVRSAIQVKFALSESAPPQPNNMISLSGIPLHLSDTEMLTALSTIGEVLEYIPSRAPGAAYSDATLKMTRPERAGALISAIRQGGLLINGYPCYTLQAEYLNKSINKLRTRQEERIGPLVDSGPPSSGLQAPCKLFIGCLPYSRTSQDLSDLFGTYGTILETALLTTPDGKSKGAAFITFANKDDAGRALAELDGFTFLNSTRPINVSYATNQTWRDPNGTPSEKL
jgi:RNA recognition motif-containing protein